MKTESAFSNRLTLSPRRTEYQVPSKMREKYKKNSNHSFEPNSIQFKGEDIHEQLKRELESIAYLLEDLRPQLQEIRAKRVQNQGITEELFELQEQILRKEKLLSEINRENKHLKSESRKSQCKTSAQFQLKRFDSSPESNNPKVFKLASELQDQKNELLAVSSLHKSKATKLEQIKKVTEELSHEYFERCRRTKQNPLTYEMFKSLNEQKKRQLNMEPMLAQARPKRETIKQFQASNNLTLTKNKNKNFQKIVYNKKIAEQAVQSTRKKFNKEMTDLQAKLEFLREEDFSLIETLKDKELELYALQAKFREKKSRNRLATQKDQQKRFISGRLSSQNNPQLTYRAYKFDRDEQDLEKTKKIRHYLSPDMFL